MKGVCLVVVLASLAVAVFASSAVAATEVQRADETIYLELPGGPWSKVGVALYPDREAALLVTEKGLTRETSRSLGVGFAVAVPPSAFTDAIDIRFGRLGTIRGRFVPSEPPRHGRNVRACKGPRPVDETGHLVGRVRLEAPGGYLAVRADRAPAYVSRSFRLRCAHGYAQRFEHPGVSPFEYLDSPTRELSSNDGTRLMSTTRSRTRLTDFVAFHSLDGRNSTFQAATEEWLPGDVATLRWAEASMVAGSLFAVGMPELWPASATVDPPLPFHGTARYARRGRSFTGNLSVSLPGREQRLADKRAEAGICVVPQRLEFICK